MLLSDGVGRELMSRKKKKQRKRNNRRQRKKQTESSSMSLSCLVRHVLAGRRERGPSGAQPSSAHTAAGLHCHPRPPTSPPPSADPFRACFPVRFHLASPRGTNVNRYSQTGFVTNTTVSLLARRLGPADSSCHCQGGPERTRAHANTHSPSATTNSSKLPESTRGLNGDVQEEAKYMSTLTRTQLLQSDVMSWLNVIFQ